ncbi:uncharacterized protein PRCAT00000118001 [Priceomyces carsonii]|uniref:uncharacterized protein n=1 Tax=Priceomyces carsonii TaxID=28549 RepID=UPI002ED8758C|nr:unnamed protein product [Priceomyces carsonii]
MHLKSNVAITLYVLTLVVSLPFQFTSQRYSDRIANIAFLRFWNQCLIEKHGYAWFTIVYLSFILTYCSEKSLRVPEVVVYRFISVYCVNTVIFLALNIWCFGPSIFDRINTMTSGCCSIESIDYKRKCLEHNGKWINGFDVSGHMYFISSTSCLIWQEMLKGLLGFSESSTDSLQTDTEAQVASNLIGNENRDGEMDERKKQALNKRAKKWIKNVIFSYSLLYVLLTYCMYVVTCFFFHTAFEKIIGLIFGMTLPSILFFFERKD